MHPPVNQASEPSVSCSHATLALSQDVKYFPNAIYKGFWYTINIFVCKILFLKILF